MVQRTARALTSAFCRSAKPGVRQSPSGPKPDRISYPDAEVRGLELRVSATGDKTWTFRYRDRITEKQGRYTIGRYDPSVDDPVADLEGPRRLTLRGARVTARQLRAKVDAGENPARERRAARRAAKAEPLKTVADLAAAYFKACETGTHRSGRGRKKAPSTLAAEQWLWSKHTEPRLGGDTLEEVTRARVRAVLREVFEASGGQANRVRALLSQMFNYAVAEERIVVNPVSHVARVSEASARTRTVNDDEMRALWNALQNSDELVIPGKKAGDKVMVSRSVRIAIELAMFTLQRRGEIAGMRRCELDLERKTWLIPAERTKGRAEHLVPLSGRAVALIEAALALQETRKKGTSEFVFPSPYNNDESVEPAALSHAMADLTAAVALDDVRLHDLRRTGATGIAALGVQPHIVSKVLAHKDGGGGAAITARHYNLYAYVAEKREALDRWSHHLESLLGLTAEPPSPQASPSRASASPTVSVSVSAERLWTDLVEVDVPPVTCPTGERLWTDLVES